MHSQRLFCLFAVLVTPVLNAQSFRNVPALQFTKVFAGAAPLPQTLTLASTGASFTFRVTASTTSGGTWLTATGCGAYCDTPQAITVTANPAVDLAPGTYSGQVVFTEFYNTFSMTVPVTLTVAAAGSTFLDTLPGQVSFTLAAGGSSPPSQSFQIRNGGAGSLNWTLTSSTADGANWLSVSPGNGTAPSQVTVSLQKNNLPGGGVTAGTFVGQIQISGGSGSVTIPVSVVVGQDFSQVNALAFTKLFAAANNPLPQIITAASTGANFTFRVSTSTSTGGNWLTATGCGAYCDTPQAITVAMTPAPDLPAGTYTGQVVLTEFYGSFAITVPVTLTVAAPGTAYFDSLGGQMAFTLLTGGSTIQPQSFTIRNGGSGPLNWTLSATTADGGNWLHVSSTAGLAPSQVTVSITAPNLPGGGLVAGTFVGEIALSSPQGPITIPVSVTVGAAVFRELQPLSFTKVYAGADPLPQTLTIASTGATFTTTVSVSTANGGSWLTATGCGAYCNTPQAITAKITTDPALAIGTYTGEIILREFYGSMAVTVPVTLTVVDAATPHFNDLPGQMSFSMKTAGNAPPAQTLEILNGGSGTLSWTLTETTADGGNWLNASLSSGTAPSQVSVSIQKTNLPGSGLVPGTFIGHLDFESANGGFTVAVSVVVGPNVMRQVQALHFTMPYGGANPLPQVLPIFSTGTAVTVVVTASTATGGNWLSATGCGAYCDTPKTIVTAVNAPAGLPVGTYEGQVVAREFYGSMAMTVPVILTVAPPATALFDNTQGQLSFFKQPSLTDPVSQTLQITNGGAGTLGWSLTTTTSDGGAWLTASQTSGTAPAVITIGVVASALPNSGLVAGDFNGNILLTANGSSVTVPVTVNVGTSVFNELTGLVFTKTFGGSDPLSQTFNVTATSAITFRANPYNGKGGNWLSVTGCGAYCGTPKTLTASVTANAALPPGVYTGEIVMTEFYYTQALTIPVTLTIASSGGLAQLGSVSPNKGVPGQTLSNIAIVGLNTHFVQGSTTLSFGSDITINSFTVNSATSITATVTISPAAALGPRDVTVTTGGEVVTLTSGFTVTTVGPATHLLVLPHSFTTSGVPLQFTVTALDASDNPVLNFADQVHFTSSDGSAVLPPNSTLVNGAGTFSAVLVGVGAQTITAADVTSPSINGTGASITVSAATGLRYVPVTPCRLIDTRNVATGGPFIASATSRNFTPSAGPCGVPANAQAFSLNVAVVPHGGLGFLTVWPAGQNLPTVATLNSIDGRIKSNAAIVPAGVGGAVSVYATNDTDVILDVNGYFVDASTPAALAFYPVTPCRLVDTRKNILSSGAIAGGTSRTLPIRSSSCGVPASAQAYSLNFVVVAPTQVGFLTAFPTDVPRPTVATLNALGPAVSGLVIAANAAIVPAGTAGSIDVYATNTTDVVVDINGYFGPAGPGGLALYNLPPCRVLDTRKPSGSPPFSGTRDVNVGASLCGGTSAVQAYVFNATVVPPATLGFLTLWPQGNSLPTVATLNALDAQITNNMAIVPTSNSQISAFGSNPTHLILDLFGYFAP